MGMITVHTILHPPFELDWVDAGVEDVQTLKVVIMCSKNDLSSEHAKIVLLSRVDDKGAKVNVRETLDDYTEIDNSMKEILVLHPVHPNRKRYMTPNEIEASMNASESRKKELENKLITPQNDLRNLMNILTSALQQNVNS